MKEAPYEEALKTLEAIFGDRLKPSEAREPGVAEHPISVMPVNAGEVQLLAEVAQRYSIPLAPQGAGTIAGAADDEESILVRFDLMRHTKLPEDEEPWVETEPGASWLELEEELSVLGRGLAVYPTSAPRATVGGWLATDGLGVGSYEYGWLSENVLSADVVSPGGELRVVQGRDLHVATGTEVEAAVFVSAKLRTRVANQDRPFAVSYETVEALLGAVNDTVEVGIPLWHLAFLDPAMARARGLGEDYLLFGAYPGERSEEVEEGIRHMAKDHEGNVLPAAGTHRVWTERFFPVAPAHATPVADRTFAPIFQLTEILSRERSRERIALQGTIARSKEVLILTFEPRA